MKKSLLILLAFIVLFNLSAVAQDEDSEKDVLEVVFRGGLNLPTGDIKTFSDSLGAKSKYGMGVDIGYFFTPSIVAGAGFNFTNFGIDNNETDTKAEGLTHRLYSPSLYVKYYIPSELNFSPYFKGSVGLDFAKFTSFVSNENGDRYRQLEYSSALSYGIGAGMFYYTSDFGGFFFDVNYHMSSSSGSDANYEGADYVFDNNLATIDLNLGIRVLFGNE